MTRRAILEILVRRLGVAGNLLTIAAHRRVVAGLPVGSYPFDGCWLAR